MGMLDGRAAVIVGSGGGMGRETALLMAREGASVVFNDPGDTETEPNGVAAEEVVDAIRGSGGQALASSEPVGSLDGAHRLMQKAVDRFGHIDVVVNNLALAPANERAGVDEVSRDAWETALRSPLKATFCCTRAALTYMRPRRQGRFVHVMPAAGLIGSVGQAHDGAVMMAIAGFIRNVAIEMERVHITSNCIAPHASPRNMPAPAGGTAGGPGCGDEKMPWAEAAPLAVFLAGDAAGEISGQLFGVRGKEIYLFSQSRISRSIHHSQGWTVEALARMVEPAMGSSFTPMNTADSYFSWDEML